MKTAVRLNVGTRLLAQPRPHNNTQHSVCTPLGSTSLTARGSLSCLHVDGREEMARVRRQFCPRRDKGISNHQFLSGFYQALLLQYSPPR